MSKTKEVKVLMNNHSNRSDMVVALFNSGYKVWLEVTKRSGPTESDDNYWVVFLINE